MELVAKEKRTRQFMLNAEDVVLHRTILKKVSVLVVDSENLQKCDPIPGKACLVTKDLYNNTLIELY
jgi:hypothetical protein|tara:strand:- start:1873 stop:2073 length:201 start_codon:yes stop_codon:yes gene_type:complete